MRQKKKFKFYWQANTTMILQYMLRNFRHIACLYMLINGVGTERAKNSIVPLLPSNLQKEFNDRHQKQLKRQKDYYYKLIKATSSSTKTLHADLSNPVREVVSTNNTHITKQHVEVGILTSPDSQELLRLKSQLQPAINTDQAATSQRPGLLAAEIATIVGPLTFSSAVDGRGMYAGKRSEIKNKLLDDVYSNQDVADYINSFDIEPNDIKQYYLIYRGLDEKRRRDVWRLLSSKAQNSYTRRGKNPPKFSSTPLAMPRNKRLAEETGEQASAPKKQRRLVPMPRAFVAPMQPTATPLVTSSSTLMQPTATPLVTSSSTLMQPTATPLATSSSTHSLQQDPFFDETAKYTSKSTSSSANAFSSTHRAAPGKKRSVDAVEKSMDQFHQSFKSEHIVFSGSIKGIADDSDRKRYALLTMNRLVFLAFLQKKGFLNGDRTYLQTHLTQAQTVDGPNGTSYRAFLSTLFHNGLNQPARSPEQPFGKVPYLKIDLFDQHALEDKYPAPKLKIPNRAFKRLLDFFERYYWQLDDATPQGEADINPETFSRTLEIMANLKETASYYTKKDVAEYISTNAIIPSLFDELQKKHPEVFSPASSIWSLLRKDFADSPQEARAKDQIAGIEDLITSNLDGRTFAQRFIATCDQPEILLTFYQSLEAITILDPTCGTGAFLFAASNILAPLYEASLIQMQDMVHAYSGMSQEPPEIAHFRTFLQEAEQVPLRYFALKSLISKNLYGVDIMPQAVEVCKLCFNLKLLAQVDNPEDLREVSLSSAPAGRDVNVRVGNTLVGFDWENEFQQVMQKQNGKFRVIVGNPPYGKVKEISLSYTIPATFETLKCGDLYPCVVEKSQQLLSSEGYMGMIIPIAAFGTRGKLPLLKRFYTWFPRSWVSFYHYVPGNLFDTGKGAHVAVAVFVAKSTGEEQRFSTKLRRWENSERNRLFSDVRYTPVDIAHGTANHYYPKFGSRRESRIMGKIRDPKHPLVNVYFGERISDDNGIWSRTVGGPDWKIFRNTPWLHKNATSKDFYIKQNYDRDVFVALFNSSLFWWYCNTIFDSTRQTTDYMLESFPFPYPQDKETIDQLRSSAQHLMMDFETYGHSGNFKGKPTQFVFVRKSKNFIDKIDQILATHYGLTKKELNFIANYDLNFRMGDEFKGEVNLSLHPKKRNAEEISLLRSRKRTKNLPRAVSPAGMRPPSGYPSVTPYHQNRQSITPQSNNTIPTYNHVNISTIQQNIQQYLRMNPTSYPSFNPYNPSIQDPGQQANNPIHWNNPTSYQRSTPPAPAGQDNYLMQNNQFLGDFISTQSAVENDPAAINTALLLSNDELEGGENDPSESDELDKMEGIEEREAFQQSADVPPLALPNAASLTKPITEAKLPIDPTLNAQFAVQKTTVEKNINRAKNNENTITRKRAKESIKRYNNRIAAFNQNHPQDLADYIEAPDWLHFYRKTDQYTSKRYISKEEEHLEWKKEIDDKIAEVKAKPNNAAIYRTIKAAKQFNNAVAEYNNKNPNSHIDPIDVEEELKEEKKANYQKMKEKMKSGTSSSTTAPQPKGQNNQFLGDFILSNDELEGGENDPSESDELDKMEGIEEREAFQQSADVPPLALPNAASLTKPITEAKLPTDPTLNAQFAMQKTTVEKNINRAKNNENTITRKRAKESIKRYNDRIAAFNQNHPQDLANYIETPDWLKLYRKPTDKPIKINKKGFSGWKTGYENKIAAKKANNKKTSSSTTAPQPPTTTASQPVARPQIAPLQTYTGLQRNYHTVLAELHTQETKFYHTIANFERGLTEESSVNEEREMFRTRQARALAAWHHMATFAQQHPHAGIPLPNMPEILTRKI